MKILLRVAFIITAVLITIYLGAALVLTFLPEPTFTTGPFPVAETAVADFTPQQFTARDGETLFAHHFPAETDVTILLLHGVASDSTIFNMAAPMLREVSGAAVVALDLRGHGQSEGIAGDVDYIGQYEDDVADVIAAIRAEKPDGRLILAGHSMGGGIALRFAQLPDAPSVDGYLLFAPHLGTNAPTMPAPQPETSNVAAAFTQLHVPRLIGLTMLNVVGIQALNQQDTLFFNLPDTTTHTYSYRAMVNTAPTEYGAALTAVNAPLLVVVGSHDEAFVAEQFPTAVSAYSDGEVHVVPEESHNSIVESATAMTIIQNWLDDTQLTTKN